MFFSVGAGGAGCSGISVRGGGAAAVWPAVLPDRCGHRAGRERAQAVPAGIYPDRRPAGVPTEQ